jgi:Domain of unknown function (DUF5597)/Beta-galactosidase
MAAVGRPGSRQFNKQKTLTFQKITMIKNAAIKFFALVALSTITTLNARSQHPDEHMPKLISKDGRHALIIDGAPFFILGVQAHNSSGWPTMLPQLWEAVEDVHANTLEVPVYWEQIEARPGGFDFSLVDTLLAQARAHKVRLVLLWFATWKNGSNHYMPEWMKRDAAKYPNIQGKTGKPVDSPSPNADATLEADKKAFARLMGYLKKADARHTVIMVQVENESGAWGSVRDYSPTAQKLFDAPVPAELLKPGLLNAMHVPVISGGNWQQVFGDRADEYFHAWSVARFIGQVAAAGKTEYGIPLYANAALRDPLTNPTADNYESGGPTDNVIPIWKAAAPAIDLLAPDIYLTGTDRIMKVIELYDRPDNALFVPELAWNPDKVKYLYEVIARGGIGYSPFGADNNGDGSTKTETTARLAPFAKEYALLNPMMREFSKWGYEGRIRAVVEHEDHAAQIIELGKWQAIVNFGSGERIASDKINEQPTGKLMVVKMADDEFILVGTSCRISFRPAGRDSVRAWQYGKAEEIHYEKGTFKPLRILNGDETDWGGPRFGASPTMVRASLILR